MTAWNLKQISTPRYQHPPPDLSCKSDSLHLKYGRYCHNLALYALCCRIHQHHENLCKMCAANSSVFWILYVVPSQWSYTKLVRRFAYEFLKSSTWPYWHDWCLSVSERCSKLLRQPEVVLLGSRQLLCKKLNFWDFLSFVAVLQCRRRRLMEYKMMMIFTRFPLDRKTLGCMTQVSDSGTRWGSGHASIRPRVCWLRMTFSIIRAYGDHYL